MISAINGVVIMTGRGKTGKRHIVMPNDISLCGRQRGFVGKLRPRSETEDRLMCKVCLRKERELI
ncbi:MAG: hypothetical protein ABFD54_05805 [Armatimonadota bacterium]|nr:hypothetical protein [bacterium]